MSSQWSNTGKLLSAASLKACLATLPFITDLPSSLTAGAPCFLSASKSVINSPSSPAVIATSCNTFTYVSALILSLTSSNTSTQSTTGLVLGIAQIVVKPPLAAALAPVLIVSLCSCPGSLKCTWRSIRPGIT